MEWNGVDTFKLSFKYLCKALLEETFTNIKRDIVLHAKFTYLPIKLYGNHKRLFVNVIA